MKEKEKEEEKQIAVETVGAAVKREPAEEEEAEEAGEAGEEEAEAVAVE